MYSGAMRPAGGNMAKQVLGGSGSKASTTQRGARPTAPKTNGNRNKPDAVSNSGKKPRLLSEAGISRKLAAKIRASLLSFEEDWNAPGMEAYDEY